MLVDVMKNVLVEKFEFIKFSKFLENGQIKSSLENMASVL